jgi:hypothetical protein
MPKCPECKKELFKLKNIQDINGKKYDYSCPNLACTKTSLFTNKDLGICENCGEKNGTKYKYCQNCMADGFDAIG